jgi:tRNA-2-methylthio-N6-dimethylallyladenosine synthase
MSQETVYIETMGCQMNVLDSELVLGQLRQRGFDRTPDMNHADVVLLNTCSVREHAEDKALSRLGSLKKTKSLNPDMIVGVIGCMAERDPDGIISKMPHVDLICGPSELNKIPAMIDEIRETRQRSLALSQSLSRKSTPLERALEYDSVEALDLSRHAGVEGNPIQAYVRVQRGCDKFCTFCVVPFTRGAERSRPPRMIVEEAKMLVDRGAREVTLLGQTVNSYVHQENGKAVRFSDLLAQVDAVPGLERLRFVTSYPGDFGDDIFEAMRDLPTVCEYLHMPAQSGNDDVLKRMRRQYTVGAYRDLLARARDYVPEITLASDFIVGFCGETDQEFNDTVRLVEESRFKNIFVFKYSKRPDTVAAKRAVDDIPDDVKRLRNNELLRVQERMSIETNRRLIGREFQVLVEGYSKRAVKAQEAEQTRGEEISPEVTGQLVGRTRTDRIAVFAGDSDLIGRLVNIRVTAATALTLHGECVDQQERHSPRLSSLPIAG